MANFGFGTLVQRPFRHQLSQSRRHVGGDGLDFAWRVVFEYGLRKLLELLLRRDLIGAFYEQKRGVSNAHHLLVHDAILFGPGGLAVQWIVAQRGQRRMS